MGSEGEQSGECSPWLVGKLHSLPHSSKQNGKVWATNTQQQPAVSLQEARMSGSRMIVVAGDNRMAKVKIIWDIDPSLEGEDTSIVLPVREVGAEGWGNFTGHGLEGSENDEVRGGGGCQLGLEGSVNEVDEKGAREKGYRGVVIIISGEKVRAERKSIRGREETTRDMDHFEIKISQVEKPVGMFMVEILRLVEVGQVFMVGENLNWERGALKIVVPGVKTMDDSKEFSVVDVIVSFSGGERLGEVGAGVTVPISISFQKDSSRGVLGGICSDGKGVREIWGMENWLGEEELLETFEGGLAGVTIQGDGLLFSIICLPLLSSDSPFTFTISIMFLTDTY